MDRTPRRPIKDILTLYLIRLNTYEEEHAKSVTDALHWLGHGIPIVIVFLLSFVPAMFTLDLLRAPALSNFFVTILTFMALCIAYTVGSLLILAGLSLLIYKALDLFGLIPATGDDVTVSRDSFIKEREFESAFRNAIITDNTVDREKVINDLNETQSINSLRAKIKELIIKCDHGDIIDQPHPLIQGAVASNTTSVGVATHAINTHIPTFEQSHSIANS